MRWPKRSRPRREAGLGFIGPRIRGPRLSLFPLRFRGPSLSGPKARVKNASIGGPAVKAGASLVTCVINRAIGRLFGGLFRRR